MFVGLRFLDGSLKSERHNVKALSFPFLPDIGSIIV
jgi:hypothetical protein